MSEPPQVFLRMPAESLSPKAQLKALVDEIDEWKRNNPKKAHFMNVNIFKQLDGLLKKHPELEEEMQKYPHLQGEEEIPPRPQVPPRLTLRNTVAAFSVLGNLVGLAYYLRTRSRYSR